MTKRFLAIFLTGMLLFGMLTACGDKPPVESGTPTTTTTEDDGIFDLGDDAFGTTTTTGAQGDTDTTTPTGSTGSTTGGTSQTTGKTTAKTTKKTSAKETNRTYDQVDNLNDLKEYEKAIYKKLPDLKTDAEKKVVVLSNSKAPESPMLGRKYGVSLETVVVSQSELVSKYVSMVNAETPPDVMIGNFNYTLISKGYVQAWDSYTDLKGSTWKKELPHMDNYAVGKKHYLFVPKDPNGGGHLMYVVYNAELMDEVGLTQPATLFAQKKWDWDAFLNTVEKLVGRGKSGVWMYNGPQAFVNSTGHDYVDFVNGRATNMLKSADITRSIQAYSDLVALGGVYGGNDAIERLSAGNLGMIVGTQGTVMALKDEILADKVNVTAFPRDPKKDEYYMPYMGNGFYLAKGAKHPNNAVAWMTCWHYEQDAAYKKALNKEL